MKESIREIVKNVDWDSDCEPFCNITDDLVLSRSSSTGLFVFSLWRFRESQKFETLESALSAFENGDLVYDY